MHKFLQQKYIQMLMQLQEDLMNHLYFFLLSNIFFDIVDINNNIKKCEKCEGKIIADPDTFDTWFSSSQWPFITLDYPAGKDFKDFYPTDVMETASDILFFWVTRMIMLGLYRTGEVPFKNVYLHGVVRDKHGKKMSKSKGNVTNPIEITDQYGTDALRMSLVVANTPGTDTNLDTQKVLAYKKFANKLWNITRFIMAETKSSTLKNKPPITADDQKLLDELSSFVKDTTDDMENMRFHLASEKIYHYVWHRLADSLLEESKEILNDAEHSGLESRRWTLLYILSTSLKLLHPFMPFITEEIWEIMNKNDNDASLLIIEPWPKPLH